MCAYYYDNEKIKKGDSATYLDSAVTILSAQHIKDSRTMDIVYSVDSDLEAKEFRVNVPYKTSDFEFVLLKRKRIDSLN